MAIRSLCDLLAKLSLHQGYPELFYLALRKMQLRVVWGRCVQVCVVVLLEFSVTANHGAGEVPVMNLLGDLLSFLHSIHEGSAHDLVLTNSDNGRGRVGGHFQHGANGLNTLQGGKPAVIGAGCTTTLGVTQNGGSGIQAQTLGKDVLNGRARDLVELAVLRSLGDNDDRTALASLLAVLLFKK